MKRVISAKNKYIIFGVFIICFIMIAGSPPISARDFQVLYDLRVDGNVNTPYGGIGRYENKFTYSEQFDNGAWSKAAITVAADDITAPDGVVSADKLTSSGDGILSRSFTPANTNYHTFSIWLRTNSGTNSISLSAVRSSPWDDTQRVDITVTSTWQRFSLTFSPLDTSSHIIRIGAWNGFTSGEILYAWGAQLEEASNPGVYCKTTSGTVTASRGIVSTGDFLMPSLKITGGSITDTSGTVTVGSTNNLSISGNLQVTGSGPHYISNGNVGIGTMVPGEKLEVFGKLKMDDETLEVTSVTFDGDTSAGLKLTNPRGYITLTPLNTGWAHIYTDRPSFIFNKAVYSIDDIFSSYDADLLLRRAGTTKITAGTSTVTLADTLTVNGSGNNYFAGNVGVGTMNPAYKLQINRTTGSAITPFIHLFSTDLATGGGAAIDFKASTNTTVDRYLARIAGIRDTVNDGSSDILFYTDNVGGDAFQERMRITYTGNVGIGTVAPTALLAVGNNAFRVASNGTVQAGTWNGTALTDAYVSDTLTASDLVAGSAVVADSEVVDGLTISGGTINATAVGATVASTGAFTTLASSQGTNLATASGNVGIGTIAPNSKLYVYGSQGTASGITVYSPETYYGRMWIQNNIFNIGNTNSTPISLMSNSNVGVYINTSGNVGIGTIAPVNILQVGSMGASGYQGSDFALGNGTDVFAIDLTSGRTNFYANGNYTFVPSGGTGNVGIGTVAPTALLAVGNNAFKVASNGTVQAGTWNGTAVGDTYVADTLTISGGTINNTVIGGTVSAAGTFTNLTASGTLSLPANSVTDAMVSNTLTASDLVAGSEVVADSEVAGNLTISGGTINASSVGATVASTGAFTTLSSTQGTNLAAASGNVGIGTIVPIYKLDVIGTGRISSGLTANVTGDLTGNVTAGSGSSSFNQVTVGGGYGTTGITLTSDGNLQLDGNLYVKGVMYRENLTDLQVQNNTITLNASDAPADADAYIGVMSGGTKASPTYTGQLKWVAASDRWDVGTSGAQNGLYVSGNVGIGTIAPVAALAVGNNAFKVGSNGTVTAGTWNGTALTDAYVSDTLTASDLVAGSAVVADSEVVDTLTISGGTINNTAIGGTVSAAGTFTNLTASGTLSLPSNSVTDAMVSNTLTASDLAAGSEVVADSEVAGNLTISGGTINASSIGSTVASTGAFTTLSSTQGTNLATASGNVGVGTTSPVEKLEIVGGNLKVNGNITATGNISGTLTGTIGSSNVTAGTFAAGNFTFPDNLTVQDNAYLATTSGNVGIGTVAPTEKLTVSGDILQLGHSDTIGGSGIYLGAVGDGLGYANLRIDNSFNLNIDRLYSGTWYNQMFFQRSSGNVGIGTMSPVEKLHVMGDIGLSDSGGLTVDFDNLGTTYNIIREDAGHITLSSVPGGNFIIQGLSNEATEGIIFKTNNTGPNEIMRITHGGNVGIGTMGPETKLHTYGASGYIGSTVQSGTKALTNWTDASNDLATYWTTGSALRFGVTTDGVNVTGWSEKVRIQSNGNVGIGTTAPLAALTVGNNAFRVASNGTVQAGTWNGTALTDAYVSDTLTASDLVAGSAVVADSEVVDTLTISGGTINNTVIGGTVSAAGTFTNLIASGTLNLPANSVTDAMVSNTLTASDLVAGSEVVSDSEVAGNLTISGGTINATSVGATVASTGAFTTLSSTQGTNLATASGNVGVGTTSPVEKLEIVGGNLKVNGNITATGNISGTLTGTIAASNVTAGTFAAGNFTFPDNLTVQDNAYLATTSGNVGVGTISPSNKLHIVGSIEVGAASGSGVNPAITNSNNLANYSQLQFYPASGTNTNMSFSIIPRGTGVTNNVAQFSVLGTDYIADSSNYEFAGLRARGSDFVFGTGKNGTGSVRQLILSSGIFNGTNLNQLVLDAAGNVGIGTTAPTALLAVGNNAFRVASNGTVQAGVWNGTALTDAYVSDTLTISGGTINNTAIGGTVASTGVFTTVTTTGNVGIGTTTPNYKLDTAGNIGLNGNYLYLNSAGSFIRHASGGSMSIESRSYGGNGNITVNPAGYLYLNYSSGSGIYLGNGASGTTGIIQTTGNVGIGTVAPTALLAVGNNAFRVASNGTVQAGVWNGTVLTDAYVSDTLTISGGTINNTIIGGTVSSAGTFTNLTASGTLNLPANSVTDAMVSNTLTASDLVAGSEVVADSEVAGNLTISGGTINATSVGATVASTGAFTTLSSTQGTNLSSASGNVGIGTIAPIYKLDVIGAGRISSGLTANVTGDLTGNVTAASGSSSFNQVTVGGGYGATGVTLTSDGNLQLDGNLYVKGVMYRENLTDLQVQNNTITLNASDAPADADAYIGVMSGGTKSSPTYIGQLKWAAANDRWDIGTTGTQNGLYVSGNVGIGTTSPTSALSVGNNAFRVGSNGTVQAGVWNGTALTDAYVSDTLTASDLVAGSAVVADSEVVDTLTISGGTINATSVGATVASTGAFTTLSSTQGTNLAIASGNVGIGTASPTAKLHVLGGVNVTDRIYTDFNSVRTYQNVAHYYNSNTINTGTIVITIGSTPNIMLDAEIVVQGYGGVHRYYVRGYTYTGSTTWWMPEASCIGSGAGSNSVRFGKNTTTNDRVILLGTTSTIWGSYPHVLVTRVTASYPGSGGIGDWSIAIVTSESDYSEINSVDVNNGFSAYGSTFSGSTNFPFGIWSSNGNVGIGTISPIEKIEIVGGNLKVGGNITATGNISGTYTGTVAASNVTTGTFAAGNFTFPDNLTVQDNVYLAATSGNVGIGTIAPVSKLDVNGDIAFSNDGTHKGVFSYYDSGSYDWSQLDPYGETFSLYDGSSTQKSMYIWYAATNYLRILGPDTNSGAVSRLTTFEGDIALMPGTNGNVGIGTTAPTALLSVGNNAFRVASNGTVQAGTWNGTALTDAYVSDTLTASDLVAGSAVVADSEVVDTLTVSGGTINNTVIGGTVSAAGTFTNLTASGTLNLPANSVTDAMVSNTLTASDLVAGSEVVADSEVAGNLTISGGTINASSVGATVASTGAFTTLSSTQGTNLATASGNVGIGTTSPIEKLEIVGGNLKIGGNVTVTGTITQGGTGLIDGSGTLNYMPKWSDSNTLTGTSLIYDTGANVGIGTIAPTALLAVGNNVFRVASNGTVQAGTWNGTALTDAYVSDTLTASDLVAGSAVVADSEVVDTLTISSGTINATSVGATVASTGAFTTLSSTQGTNLATASGNVGIGTTSPGEKLEVNGNIRTKVDNAMPNIVLDSSAGGDNWTSQGAYISIGESGSLGSAALHLTYIGDGTSYIGSGAVTTGIPAQSYLKFYYSTKNIYTDSNFQNAATGLSYFMGNLGIGTTSPTAKLSVGNNVFKVASNGTVQAGVWNGTALTDAYVSDTLTASDLVAGSAVVADSEVVDTLTISGGTINNTVIGGTVSAAGTFTNLTASGTLNLPANSVTDAMVSNTLTASDLVAGSAVVADSEVVDGLTISGGTINATSVGATVASTGAFTTLSSTLGTNLATASGNVGIGTIAPEGKLNIVGGSAWTTSGWIKGLRLDSTSSIELGGGAGTKFGMGQSSNILYHFYTATETSSGDSAHYYYSVDSTGNQNFGNNSLYVVNSGNVGVGTTSPVEKLQVEGNLKLQGNIVSTTDNDRTFQADGGLIMSVDANSNNSNTYFQIKANAENGLIMSSKTRSSAPWYQAVIGFNTASEDASTVLIKGGDSTAALNALNVINSSSSPLLIIQNGGNVGIGTTSPTSLLHVAGNGNITGTLTAGTFAPSALTVTGNTYLATTSGNVGIGTVVPTDHQLLINSSRGAASNSALKIMYNGGTAVLGEVSALAHRNGVWDGLYVNGTGSSLTNAVYVEGNKPVIFIAGNVGIGTTSATQKLDVAGTINATTIQGANVTTGTDPGHAHTDITTKGSYVWTSTDTPRSFPTGVSTSFVRTNEGWQSYGTVLNVKGYSAAEDGSVLQIYSPYNSALGGDYLQYRMGLYNNAGWTAWKTLVDTSGAKFTGNVGIGTTNPAYTLEARGASGMMFGGATWDLMRIDAGGTDEGTHILTRGLTVGNSYTAVEPADGNLLVSGSVGIGTTSPSYPLDIGFSGDNTIQVKTIGTANSASITLASGNGTTSGRYAYYIAKSLESSPQEWRWGMYGNNNWNLRDNTAGAYRLTVNTGGNVGIGTTNPEGALDVYGTGFYTRAGSLNAWYNYGGSLIIGPWDAGSWLYFVSGGAVQMTITDTGNVGIGTGSLNYKLQVAGSFAAQYKNFVIPHPLDTEHKLLVHSSIEGPEHAVYYRGEDKLINGEAVIVLPNYFEALTRKENRAVLLTAKGKVPYLLSYTDIIDGRFNVYGTKPDGEFSWEVKAVRNDIPILKDTEDKPK